jgi:V8-like Glu-specific endopeptidase
VATREDDLHTPVNNRAREDKPEREELSEPEVGSDGDEAEPQGELEAGAADPNQVSLLESTEEAPRQEAPDTSALPDAGAASFDIPTSFLETVHGPDNRVQISNTTQFPFRAIASLLITARDGTQYIGTGWFISARTLVTAGHCVFIHSPSKPARHGFARSIQVMPGRNGSTLPYGSVTSTEFWTVRGWAEGGNENYDYGAIIIPTPLGDQVGRFGYGAFPDAELKQRILNVTGYPGDKPSGTLWHDSKKAAALSSTKVHYDIDTFGGQSGAPVYMIRNGSRYGVAVHAYGGGTTNSGTRISSRVFNNLRSWAK